MATPWVVKQASLAGFLKRAPIALLAVAPKPRFSPAVADYFVDEHGDVSLGTLAAPACLLVRVTALFEDAASLDAAPVGYYLFRDARALVYHPGALERAPVPRSIRGVIAAAADVAAKAVDPLDAVSARAVIDAFEAALAGAAVAPRRAATDSPYAVLKVPPSATDREVKAAREKALLENHPDRVAQMGAEIRDLAKRNTQAIHAAYEAIRTLRRAKG